MARSTRLVPGFVIDTKLEGRVRIVTFGNGMVIREPIVTIDDAAKRLVWSAEGGMTTHYNAAVEVLSAERDRRGSSGRRIFFPINPLAPSQPRSRRARRR